MNGRIGPVGIFDKAAGNHCEAPRHLRNLQSGGLIAVQSSQPSFIQQEEFARFI